MARFSSFSFQRRVKQKQSVFFNNSHPSTTHIIKQSPINVLFLLSFSDV